MRLKFEALAEVGLGFLPTYRLSGPAFRSNQPPHRNFLATSLIINTYLPNHLLNLPPSQEPIHNWCHHPVVSPTRLRFLRRPPFYPGNHGAYRSLVLSKNHHISPPCLRKGFRAAWPRLWHILTSMAVLFHITWLSRCSTSCSLNFPKLRTFFRALLPSPFPHSYVSCPGSRTYYTFRIPIFTHIHSDIPASHIAHAYCTYSCRDGSRRTIRPLETSSVDEPGLTKPINPCRAAAGSPAPSADSSERPFAAYRPWRS